MSDVIEIIEKATGKPAEKPAAEKKIYKGTRIKLADLENKSLNGIIVQTFPETQTWTDPKSGSNNKLPNIMILEKVEKSHNNDIKVITYYNRKSYTKSNKYVPANIEFNTLDGRMGNEVKAKFQEFRVSNLAKFVGHVNMTVGTDPEIFVEDAKGRIIPAFEFLNAKDKAFKNSDNCSIYWDGFQAEFEVKAGTCLAYMSDSTHRGLRAVLDQARKKFKGAVLSAKTVIDVPYEVLESSKSEHVAFGCMPSKNIYGLAGKMSEGSEVPYRFAGGHIHFGIGKAGTKYSEAQMKDMVRMLDKVLAVSCVSLFSNYDNPIRREYYGLPGEYRLPPHGLEYRTLSNAWLFHPAILNLVFDLARRCCAFGINEEIRHFWQATEEETINTILTSDVEQARKIMERNKPVLLSLLKSAYNYNEDCATVGYNVLFNGMESAIKNPTDIIGNWKLTGSWSSHCDGSNKSWQNSITALKGGLKI